MYIVYYTNNTKKIYFPGKIKLEILNPPLPGMY